MRIASATITLFLAVFASGCGDATSTDVETELKEEATRLRTSLADMRAQLDEKDAMIASKDAERERMVSDARELEEALLTELNEAKSRGDQLSELVRDLNQKLDALSTVPQDAPVEEDVPDKLRERMDDASRRLVALGAKLLGDRQFEAARMALLVARQLGAANPIVDFHLAAAAAETGQYEAAEANYLRAAEELQGREESLEMLRAALLNAGVARERLHDYAGAAELYEKALALDQQYAAPYYNLGVLYSDHLKDADKAVQMLRKHVVLNGSRTASAELLIQRLEATSRTAE